MQFTIAVSPTKIGLPFFVPPSSLLLLLRAL